MNIFYDFINKLYTKEEYIWIENYYEKINCISIINVISKEDGTLKYIKKIIKYMYYLENKHLLILLHSVVPKRFRSPFIKYIKKSEDKQDVELHNRIKKYFNYSDNEYLYIKKNINLLINKDLKKYYSQFGLVFKRTNRQK